MAINPVNSGDLRYKVQFLAPTETQNDEGGREKAYSVLLTTWAAIRNVSNYGVQDPKALLDTKEFFVRYNENRVLTCDHLLLYKGTVYEVTGVEVVQERQRFIKLTCKNRGGIQAYLQTQTGAAVYNYTATGGESVVTASVLQNKTLLLVARSGIAVEMVNAVPKSDEVLFTSAAGQLLFGSALSPDEWVMALFENG